jgi:hypothetical protein
MVTLVDLRMNDGSRHFGALPETYDSVHPQWHRLRAHLLATPGIIETGFATDDVTEAWVDFQFQGHHFTLNNQLGEWLFFVKDPACPDDVLLEVLRCCECVLA